MHVLSACRGPEDLPVTAAAAEYGFWRRHLQRLLARYRLGGPLTLEPRSRHPHTNAAATSLDLRSRVVELRRELAATGLGAGPVTVAWHLGRDGQRVPSTSTIRRILHTAGLITPELRKRPKSSYVRFEAAQPNGTWQSKFTHWRLADGADIELLNRLDDHSRYLLACTAHPRVTGRLVADTFLPLVEEHDIPASTRTDNGNVFTARFVGRRKALE